MFTCQCAARRRCAPSGPLRRALRQVCAFSFRAPPLGSAGPLGVTQGLPWAFRAPSGGLRDSTRTKATKTRGPKLLIKRSSYVCLYVCVIMYVSQASSGLVRDLRSKATTGHNHTSRVLRGPNACVCPGCALDWRSGPTRTTPMTHTSNTKTSRPCNADARVATAVNKTQQKFRASSISDHTMFDCRPLPGQA
jgi:hypothetical protein